MGGFKKVLTTTLLVIFGLAAQPVDALNLRDQQLKTFATCAGQLSALMEHQWLIDGPASEETEIARALVIDIIDAMLPPGRGRDVLNWRIDAKIAHAALLTRATFSKDERTRVWALETATLRTQTCRNFLLG